MKEPELSLGPDGWLKVDGVFPAGLRVRVKADASRRFRVMAVEVSNGDRPITPTLFRSINIGWIERHLNLPHVRRQLIQSGVSNIPAIGNLGSKIPPEIRGAKVGGFGKQIMLRMETAAESRLTKPKTKPFPQAFWRDVARAYRRAMAQDTPPAKLLSNEASVPTGTAQGWIKEARRRGYLGKGTRGSAGEAGSELDITYVGDSGHGTVTVDGESLDVAPDQIISLDAETALKLLDIESDWQLVGPTKAERSPARRGRGAKGSSAGRQRRR